ncbi:MAG TPA: hypothetical protein VNT26_14750, partial [Candidatus Sulfotelmatobacter sp.]|nr:hypothetical protein [Candidatus Sulfotelmatobacter sp.]
MADIATGFNQATMGLANLMQLRSTIRDYKDREALDAALATLDKDPNAELPEDTPGSVRMKAKAAVQDLRQKETATRANITRADLED